jgi:hypothetical protein
MRWMLIGFLVDSSVASISAGRTTCTVIYSTIQYSTVQYSVAQ